MDRHGRAGLGQGRRIPRRQRGADEGFVRAPRNEATRTDVRHVQGGIEEDLVGRDDDPYEGAATFDIHQGEIVSLRAETISCNDQEGAAPGIADADVFLRARTGAQRATGPVTRSASRARRGLTFCTSHWEASARRRTWARTWEGAMVRAAAARASRRSSFVTSSGRPRWSR